MKYIDFLGNIHCSTKRNYLSRVTDKEFPKYKAAELAKKWDFDYWDGDRRICYGGYKYIPGRWKPLAEKLIEYYNLKPESKVIDIGCGKGFLLHELKLLLPELEIIGVDISEYAIKNSKPEVKNYLKLLNANDLSIYDNDYFDLAISLNTLHNLQCFDFEMALKETSRISNNQYIIVESYRNEFEKQNLLYWQVTCEMFCSPEEWEWWFNKCNYNGEYSFIFFE